MPLTRKAIAVAASLADVALAAQKEAYAHKMRQLQAVFTPPLSNAELSAGLGLSAPLEGGSDVGRFLSVAPRNRRARPDTATRALIDAILAGSLLFAARPASVPGARREVLVLTRADVARLPRWWDVRDLAGGLIPPRMGQSPDWDDAAHWDLFGTTASPPTASPPNASPPNASPPTASAPTASAPTATAPTATAPPSGAPSTAAPTASAPNTAAPSTAAPTTGPANAGAVPAGPPGAGPTKAIAANSGIGSPGTAGAPHATLPPRTSTALRAPAAEAPASSSPTGTVRLCGLDLPRVGLGCMRLSTAERPDRAVALATLHASLDAGVRLLDTADTYCIDHTDLHHNEALIREALASWSGPRHTVLVATKAGLSRPGGRWLPAGAPEQLRAAALGSRAALGVDRLTLLQLHAPHGKAVPFASQIEALAALRAEGVAEHVGLCNVTAAQLDEAIAICPIASVQIELSRARPAALDNGLLLRCAQLGIPAIAHSPLGGHRRVDAVRGDLALQGAAARLGQRPPAALSTPPSGSAPPPNASPPGPDTRDGTPTASPPKPHDPTAPGFPPTPEQLALAWTLACGPDVLILPGARSPDTVRASVAAAALALDPATLAVLDGKTSRAAARAAIATAGPPEIVLVAGSPAAGKTSRVDPFLARGYERLNRDTVGGRLAGIDRRLEESLLAGQRRFVLDNTYADAKSRAPALALGARFGVPVRCVWVDTPEHEAMVNACLRMIARRGRLLDAEEIKAASKDDPNLFPPVAVRSFFQRVEHPAPSEGFAAVEIAPFRRRWPSEHTERALILDYDGTLRRSRGPAPFPLRPEDVALLPGRKEVLAAFVADGWRLLGVSNQSAVARGQLSSETVRACFDRTNELLGVSIDVRWDEHPSGPIHNWTRKPMPGLGVQLILDHHLDPARCVFVGDMESDREFAANCGFRYAEARDFFEDEGHRFVRGE